MESTSMTKFNSEPSLLNDLDFTKPNSTDTRNKVRAFLKRKFGKFSLEKSIKFSSNKD
jgi:hypothetical protein